MINIPLESTVAREWLYISKTLNRPLEEVMTIHEKYVYKQEIKHYKKYHKLPTNQEYTEMTIKAIPLTGHYLKHKKYKEEKQC